VPTWRDSNGQYTFYSSPIWTSVGGEFSPLLSSTLSSAFGGASQHRMDATRPPVGPQSDRGYPPKLDYQAPCVVTDLRIRTPSSVDGPLYSDRYLRTFGRSAGVFVSQGHLIGDLRKPKHETPRRKNGVCFPKLNRRYTINRTSPLVPAVLSPQA